MAGSAGSTLNKEKWRARKAKANCRQQRRSVLPVKPAGVSAARALGLAASLSLFTAPGLVAQTPGTLSSGSASQSATRPSSTNPNAPQATPEASQNPSTTSPSATGAPVPNPPVSNPRPALETSVWSQAGKPVRALRFEGVAFDDRDPLVAELTQKAGQPLDPEKVRADLRRLFASGRYRDISVSGEPSGDGLNLVFAGTPRFYIGRVEIHGVKQERLTSLLEFATKLDPGTAFTEAQIPIAVQGIAQSLAQNGYFQPQVFVTSTQDKFGNQIDFVFDIQQGPQARVGSVTVAGDDPGITVPQFRTKANLNCSRFILLVHKGCREKVGRETVSNALSGVRSYYQKKERLEGTISLQKQTYEPPKTQLNYDFSANQGPVVHVVINGAKVSKSRKKLIVPVYEEGAVDNDLLNEGAFNIRDFLQQQGYFNAQDSVKLLGEGTDVVTVQYDVTPGQRHKVKSVTLKGNKYFSNDLIQERLRVKKADLYVRNGTYSTQLVSADRDSIQALYRASGFTEAKVTSDVSDVDTAPSGKPLKMAEIAVTYNIDEGVQQKFGGVELNGVDSSRQDAVQKLLTAEVGQPYSLITLSNDRDSVLSYYISHGFDHARVEIAQKADPDNSNEMNVSLNVTEGGKVSIDKVLLSGLNHTRPSTVQSQITVHAEDPLDQSALLQTQRNLYNLALFNEVNAAVQNPTGNAPEKNVLVQLTEARRWDVTYGFGFEAQLGTPAVVPGQTGRGQTAAQNGKAGASPRVSLDVSRINFLGTQKTLTLHTTYGLLETVASLSLNNPQLFGNPNFTATLSFGYSNVQNISTFQASTLQGDLRVTQRYKKADTFIYGFQYRRTSVDPNSLVIAPSLIPQLSQPVRVGGPSFTYFHDTRDPSPLDATRGQYFSLAEFFSSNKLGSDTGFNRLDLSHSSYYTFGKHKYTFARNLRVGFENVYDVGSNSNIGIANCAGNLIVTNATCNPVPLPERLYAGGATSHRGFGINDAGPRDLTTGYPVGGSGVVVNTFELRLPPPVLPLVGANVSFVLFHDMGNVFRYPSDMFKSITRFHQPDEATCRNVPPKGTPVDQLQAGTGTCNFNYYSHAVGLGARYKTPVGPIRVDFSYNLNPPTYPVFYDYTDQSPYVGKAGHFQFFFSIGQSF